MTFTKNKRIKPLMTILVFMLLGTFSIISCNSNNFAKKKNGEFVTISGKVTDVTADSFTLKANGRNILIEMDDYDWDADGYKLANGDEVVVNGRIDKDFLEKKKVEAGSVYVKNIDAYFYANPEDEEDLPNITYAYSYIPAVPENAHFDLLGTVKSVSGRTFTLDTGFRTVKIDTSEMIYNPMDDIGYTQIDEGDLVRISGLIDDNYYRGDQIKAVFLTELVK